LTWARDNGVKSIKQTGEGLEVEFFPAPVDFAHAFPNKEEDVEDVEDDVMFYAS
tara:strand:- start:5987 stop:6148 length:162 start_codon:yes stop_codon:yes gene_type:complete